MRYYIWSYEHAAWWRPHASGYTPLLDEAGTYSERQAAGIVLDHIPPGEEVAVGEHYAEQFRDQLWVQTIRLRQGKGLSPLPRPPLGVSPTDQIYSAFLWLRQRLLQRADAEGGATNPDRTYYFIQEIDPRIEANLFLAPPLILPDVREQTL